jgi:hypothetical protein
MGFVESQVAGVESNSLIRNKSKSRVDWNTTKQSLLVIHPILNTVGYYPIFE